MTSFSFSEKLEQLAWSPYGKNKPEAKGDKT